MPYAIVPFYGTLSFYATHSIQFHFLGLHVCFFCFSFSFVPHTAHFDSHSITHPMCNVCVCRFDWSSVCGMVCARTTIYTHIQAQAINSFKFLALFDSLRMRLVSLLRLVCVCVWYHKPWSWLHEICSTRCSVVRLFGSPFVILSCCLCSFSLSISLGYSESVFLMDSNIF